MSAHLKSHAWVQKQWVHMSHLPQVKWNTISYSINSNQIMGGTPTLNYQYPYGSNTARRQLLQPLAQPWCSSSQNIANKQYNTYSYPTISSSYTANGFSAFQMGSTLIRPNSTHFLGFW